MTLDLTKFVIRRYDYRLRFQMQGAGTGLNALKLTHDVQQSQLALPILGEGENTITFSAGPAEGTITIEGNTAVKNDKVKERQVLILSAFITTLRAVSGSVLPPLLAHVVWNFSAALLLMLGVADV